MVIQWMIYRVSCIPKLDPTAQISIFNYIRLIPLKNVKQTINLRLIDINAVELQVALLVCLCCNEAKSMKKSIVFSGIYTTVKNFSAWFDLRGPIFIKNSYMQFVRRNFQELLVDSRTPEKLYDLQRSFKDFWEIPRTTSKFHGILGSSKSIGKCIDLQESSVNFARALWFSRNLSSPPGEFPEVSRKSPDLTVSHLNFWKNQIRTFESSFRTSKKNIPKFWRSYWRFQRISKNLLGISPSSRRYSLTLRSTSQNCRGSSMNFPGVPWTLEDIVWTSGEISRTSGEVP